MALKYSYRMVGALGNLCVVLAVLDLALDYHGRVAEVHPFDPGVALGIVAIALVGVVALVVSKCLKQLESRLPPNQEDNN